MSGTSPAPMGQNFPMSSARPNPSVPSMGSSGSSYMMPQAQNSWQPGMPVQYSSNPTQTPSTSAPYNNANYPGNNTGSSYPGNSAGSSYPGNNAGSSYPGNKNSYNQY